MDGKVFVDKMHFLHPSIEGHHEKVNPAINGNFSSEELRKMWKDIQSDYDKVMINFTNWATTIATLLRLLLLH